MVGVFDVEYWTVTMHLSPHLEDLIIDLGMLWLGEQSQRKNHRKQRYLIGRDSCGMKRAGFCDRIDFMMQRLVKVGKLGSKGGQRKYHYD